MGMEPGDWVGKRKRQMPMGTVGWIEVGYGAASRFLGYARNDMGDGGGNGIGDGGGGLGIMDGAGAGLLGQEVGAGMGDEFFGGKIGGKGIDLYLGAVIEWRYHKLYP